MKAVLAVGVLFGFVAVAAAAESQADSKAVEDVLAGRQTVAHAAWWGFDKDDSTQLLQAAINSGAKKLIIDKMAGPWIVEPIELAGNQEIEFEKGVVILAKKGSFHGGGDALINAHGKSNIKLTGYGATFQMHRADYANKELYSKAEWRTALNICGCSNITVLGLILLESGGDGIYLGAGKNRETNKNILIKDVVCDRNYRQGISVITAENLLIEDCVLKGTAGTPPAAGIDFEPNSPKECLINCVMRNCLIEDNAGQALEVYLKACDGTMAPLSIRFEKCVTRGSHAGSVYLEDCAGPKGTVRGTIDVVDCRFEDAKANVSVRSNIADGLKVRFANCTLVNRADKPYVLPPILFYSHKEDTGDFTGVEFAGFTIKETVDRPLMKYFNSSNRPIVGLSGTITVERDGQKTDYVVDQALVDRLMPFKPKTGKSGN